MRAPTLGVFVVFHNGQEKLRRCLDSVKSFADEIVAVDTGATDDSRTVAIEAGAVIYDLEWPDSFAEAYNFAMSRVRSDWTLWLDSDEWLLEGESVPLLQALESKNVYLFSLIRQDFYREGEYTEIWQPRFWRTHPRMKLQGRIHAHFPERVHKQVAQGRVVAHLPVRLGHDGFLGGITREKLRRNLSYLEAELRDRPGQLYFEICVVDTLRQLGDEGWREKSRSIMDALLARATERPSVDLASAVLIAELESLADDELECSRTEELLRYAWRWFERSAPVLWTVSSVQVRRGCWFEAYHTLLELEELVRTGTYDRHYSFDPSIVREHLFSRLAQTSLALGKLQPALEYAERALALNPEAAEAQEIASRVREIHTQIV